MARKRADRPAGQLELTDAPRAPTVAPDPPRREPAILRTGPRDSAVATWLHDEAGEPVYKVVQRGIKAASTAGVLARKSLQKQQALP